MAAVKLTCHPGEPLALNSFQNVSGSSKKQRSAWIPDQVRNDKTVVIVGPTASGKTNLAIKLAQKFNGEIISADSRAIYKGMDIGTAKPTADDRSQVKHWGIDLVEPDERFTVADFQKYANKKIAEIRARGKVPFLVGGSGLYVDSIIFDYEFGNDADQKLRTQLDKMTVEELQNYCKKYNIILPENHKNKRYLVRAIERQNVVKNTRQKIRDDVIVVGILVDGDELRKRLEIRSERMFCDELYGETKKLAATKLAAALKLQHTVMQ